MDSAPDFMLAMFVGGIAFVLLAFSALGFVSWFASTKPLQRLVKRLHVRLDRMDTTL